MSLACYVSGYCLISSTQHRIVNTIFPMFKNLKFKINHGIIRSLFANKSMGLDYFNATRVKFMLNMNLDEQAFFMKSLNQTKDNLKFKMFLNNKPYLFENMMDTEYASSQKAGIIDSRLYISSEDITILLHLAKSSDSVLIEEVLRQYLNFARNIRIPKNQLEKFGVYVLQYMLKYNLYEEGFKWFNSKDLSSYFGGTKCIFLLLNLLHKNQKYQECIETFDKFYHTIIRSHEDINNDKLDKDEIKHIEAYKNSQMFSPMLLSNALIVFSACYHRCDKNSLNVARRYFKRLNFDTIEESHDLSLLTIKAISFISAHTLKLNLPKASIAYLGLLNEHEDDFGTFNLKVRTALALKDDAALLILLKLAIERNYRKSVSLTSSNALIRSHVQPEIPTSTALPLGNSKNVPIHSLPTPDLTASLASPYSKIGHVDNSCSIPTEIKSQTSGILCPKTYEHVLEYVQSPSTSVRLKERFLPLRIIIERAKSFREICDANAKGDDYASILETNTNLEELLDLPINLPLFIDDASNGIDMGENVQNNKLSSHISI